MCLAVQCPDHSVLVGHYCNFVNATYAGSYLADSDFTISESNPTQYVCAANNFTDNSVVFISATCCVSKPEHPCIS